MRIVRDQGKYDLREAPQHYADAKGGETHLGHVPRPRVRERASAGVAGMSPPLDVSRESVS